MKTSRTPAERRPHVPALSERLAAVASLVPPGTRVADIGTGHGNLPQWLLAGSYATQCIATEKSRDCGSRLASLSLTPGIDVRFGDGLQVLRAEDRVDVLVVSGLGARSMSNRSRRSRPTRNACRTSARS